MLTLLDITKDCIQGAKFHFLNCVEDELNCKKKEKSLAYLDVAMSVISEVKKEYPTGIPSQGLDPEYTKHAEWPVDCSDIFRSGKKESGVYTIWPRSRISTSKSKSLSVYCDMDTNGGGWTVIQRRGNFSTPNDYFYKNWKSYKNGFGNLTEEFWIGNDNIYAISTQAFINKPYKIRFDLKDASGQTGYAEYSSFWIEDESADYTLHIDGYKGDAGDSMSRHNKMQFSTKDRVNDQWSGGSCSVEYQGAWWYEKCGDANLNGLYQPGIVSHKGSTWIKWKKSGIGLSEVEIKLRP